MVQKRVFLAALMAALLITGCQLGTPQGGPTPTVGLPVTETPGPTATTQATPEIVPTATQSPRPQLESPTPTFTPGPPTETFTPSPTPGPFEYVVQENDTLIFILRQFGYTELNVINDVLALNPLMSSADRLPPPGSTILIPRQTPTATPPGYELTVTFLPPQLVENLNAPVATVQVPVAEGETILGVAQQNSTTLVVLATLNPQLGFFSCDFNNPSGGPDCNVPLQVGELVNVPALTPTPTLSPTFSGSETPTSTPTYPPPDMVFPPQNASASATTFLLQWVSVGILNDNEVYLVQIEDTTSGATYTGITRSTSYELPAELVPTDGTAHTIRWRVSVAAPNEQGAYRIISGDNTWREFRWG